MSEAIAGVGIRDTWERAATALEGYDPGNYVDPREYIWNEYGPSSIGGMVGPINTFSDRAEGRNWPLFYTEQELAMTRGISRGLIEVNTMAQAALGAFTDFVIGVGNKHTVTARSKTNADLARKVQRVIDRFVDDNRWEGGYDRELFKRDRVDGEFGLSLWRVSGSRVEARDVEPVSITEPGPKDQVEAWLGCDKSSWSFGVHTDLDDVQTIHGYYVQWTANASDWDYMPGGNAPIYPLEEDAEDRWMTHGKSNTPRNVKRGWSDFFCTTKNFELARKLLRNIGEGASIQSAIAFFREHAAGVTGAKINSFIANRAAFQRTNWYQQGSSTTNVQQFDPGTIVDHGHSVTYKYGALGNNNSDVFIQVVSALLASCAGRWRMPLHILLAIQSGGSYASDLVKESPFVKSCEVKQSQFVQKEKEIFWRVIWFAWRAGEFGEIKWTELQEAVKLVISPPDVAVRERDKETDRRLKLMGAGIVSAQTVAAEEGYDYDQERTNGAKPTNVPETGGNTLAGSETPRATDETRHPLMNGEGPSESTKPPTAKQATESVSESANDRLSAAAIRAAERWRGYP